MLFVVREKGATRVKSDGVAKRETGRRRCWLDLETSEWVGFVCGLAAKNHSIGAEANINEWGSAGAGSEQAAKKWWALVCLLAGLTLKSQAADQFLWLAKTEIALLTHPPKIRTVLGVAAVVVVVSLRGEWWGGKQKFCENLRQIVPLLKLLGAGED